MLVLNETSVVVLCENRNEVFVLGHWTRDLSPENLIGNSRKYDKYIETMLYSGRLWPGDCLACGKHTLKFVDFWVVVLAIF